MTGKDKLFNHGPRPSKILILEGPDGSGKSTLGAQLEKLMAAIYIHNNEYRGRTGMEMLEIFSSQMDYVTNLLPINVPAVIDRNHISELVYGPVFRGESRIQLGSQSYLETLMGISHSILIVCYPDVEQCLTTFRSRKGDEMLESEEQLRAVHWSYAPINLPISPYVPVKTIYYDYRIPNAFNELYEQIIDHWASLGLINNAKESL